MHFEYRDDATQPLPCWCEIGRDHRRGLPVVATAEAAPAVVVQESAPAARAEPALADDRPAPEDEPPAVIPVDVVRVTKGPRHRADTRRSWLRRVG